MNGDRGRAESLLEQLQVVARVTEREDVPMRHPQGAGHLAGGLALARGGRQDVEEQIRGVHDRRLEAGVCQLPPETREIVVGR